MPCNECCDHHHVLAWWDNMHIKVKDILLTKHKLLELSRIVLWCICLCIFQWLSIVYVTTNTTNQLPHRSCISSWLLLYRQNMTLNDSSLSWSYYKHPIKRDFLTRNESKDSSIIFHIRPQLHRDAHMDTNLLYPQLTFHLISFSLDSSPVPDRIRNPRGCRGRTNGQLYRCENWTTVCIDQSDWCLPAYWEASFIEWADTQIL